MVLRGWHGRFSADGHFAAGRNWQVQGEHFPAAQAGAAQAIPAADHLSGDAEVLGYGLDGVSLVNLVAGDAARVGGGIAERVLAGGERDDRAWRRFEGFICYRSS